MIIKKINVLYEIKVSANHARMRIFIISSFKLSYAVIPHLYIGYIVR